MSKTENKVAVADCSTKWVNYKKWSSLKLANDMADLTAVPVIGGRVVEYKLGGFQFLFLNPSEVGKVYSLPTSESERVWHNFGGHKMWPAPIGLWGGPPDPLGSVMDGGKYQGWIKDEGGRWAEIELVSPNDKRVSLRFQRRIRLHKGSARVTVYQEMVNIGTRPVEYGMVDSTQLKADRDGDYNPDVWIYIPLNPGDGRKDDLWIVNDCGQLSDPQIHRDLAPGLVGIKYGRRMLNLASNTTVGWVSYVDRAAGYTLVKRFSAVPGRIYPDGGATVEVWTNQEFPYVEIDIQSPLVALDGGDLYEQTIDWYAVKSGLPTLKVTAAGIVNERLGLKEKSGKFILSGTFAVFQIGDVRAACLDKEGEKLLEVTVGEKTPLATFGPDLSIEPPPGTKLIVLEAYDWEHKLVDRLDEALLPKAQSTSTKS